MSKLIKNSMFVCFGMLVGFFSHFAYSDYIEQNNFEDIRTVVIVQAIKDVEPFDVSNAIAMAEEKEIVEPQEISGEFDILTPCGYTKEELETALSSDSHKVMLPYVDALIEAEDTYGVNAFYLMCKLGLESGWGKYMAAENNIGGWTNNDGSYRSFDSVEDCILHIADRLSTTYKDDVGTSLSAVCGKYNPNPLYLDTLMQIMYERQNKIEGVYFHA